MCFFGSFIFCIRAICSILSIYPIICTVKMACRNMCIYIHNIGFPVLNSNSGDNTGKCFPYDVIYNNLWFYGFGRARTFEWVWVCVFGFVCKMEGCFWIYSFQFNNRKAAWKHFECAHCFPKNKSTFSHLILTHSTEVRKKVSSRITLKH